MQTFETVSGAATAARTNTEKRLRIARDEMNRHGLQDWDLRINRRLKRVMGRCVVLFNRQSGEIVDRYIELSAEHMELDTDADVLVTIRHEIAHALAGFSHNDVWKTKCEEIGGIGMRKVTMAGVMERVAVQMTIKKANQGDGEAHRALRLWAKRIGANIQTKTLPGGEAVNVFQVREQVWGTYKAKTAGHDNTVRARGN